MRQRGTGSARILLLGHLDTVVSHDEHQPLRREGDQLVGSGSIDMKGGDVLALGVLRALATRREDIAEVALLLVCDEEWRTGPFAHVDRFAGFDACLCFEGGQLDPDTGHDAVVVKRKAAGTVEVRATGRSSHSGSAPDRGRNALLALAAAAQAIAGCHDPDGPDHLTAVPTVMNAGDAFNVVPAAGRLLADSRADRAEAFERVLAAVPAEVGGAQLAAAPRARVARDGLARGDHRAARAGVGGRRAPGHRRAARRRQRRQPLRRDDPRDRRRTGPAGRRRARPDRARPGRVAALAGRDRARPGGRRPVDLSAGRHAEVAKVACEEDITTAACATFPRSL